MCLYEVYVKGLKYNCTWSVVGWPSKTMEDAEGIKAGWEARGFEAMIYTVKL